MLKPFVSLTAVLLVSIPAFAVDTDGDGVPDPLDVCCETPPGIQVDATGRPLGDLDDDCDVDQDDFGIFQANLTGPNTDPEPPCEPLCEQNGDCPAAMYCEKPTAECEAVGICVAPPAEDPADCPPGRDPVCGCDGKSYANACLAAVAGVSLLAEAGCPCSNDATCPEEWFCGKAAGDCDGTGNCTLHPGNCPAIYDPVCGCDGQTYGNACEATAAGVNVQYEGVCLDG